MIDHKDSVRVFSAAKLMFIGMGIRASLSSVDGNVWTEQDIFDWRSVQYKFQQPTRTESPVVGSFTPELLEEFTKYWEMTSASSDELKAIVTDLQEQASEGSSTVQQEQLDKAEEKAEQQNENLTGGLDNMPTADPEMAEAFNNDEIKTVVPNANVEEDPNN